MNKDQCSAFFDRLPAVRRRLSASYRVWTMTGDCDDCATAAGVLLTGCHAVATVEPSPGGTCYLRFPAGCHQIDIVGPGDVITFRRTGGNPPYKAITYSREEFAARYEPDPRATDGGDE